MTTPAELMQLLQDSQAKLLAEGAPFERIPVEHHGQTVHAYKNAFPHLPALLNAGRAHGDQEFIVYQQDRWTFNRFFKTADALAARLQSETALKPGERVAIAMRNRPEWAIAFVAVALTGAIPVLLNSFGLESELLAALEDTQPKLLICDEARYQRMSQTAPIDQQIRSVLVDGHTPLSVWSEWTQPVNGQVLDAVNPGPLDPAVVLFTSGATSRAKAVVSNHRAVCQALFNIDFIGAISAMTSPQALQKMMAAGVRPTTLTAVPLFHVSGLHAQLLVALRHGRRLVFMHRWNPEEALDLIQKEKVTQFNGAPAMVQQLLDQPGFDDPAITGTLMGLGFGGAGLSQRLIQRTLQARPDSLSGIGFGMTETNGAGSAASGQLFAYHPECSGVRSPLVDIRIVNQEGVDCPDGEAGEVCIRSVTLMDAYWNQPQATARTLQQGWLHTGDIGCLESNGYLRIVDRIKDIINRSGEKIAAAEVESCLLQHPMVDEAAVMALPDEQTGECVAAVVSLKPNQSIDAATLTEFVATKLAAHKVPKCLHVCDAPLPRTATGKVIKKTLHHLFSTNAA